MENDWRYFEYPKKSPTKKLWTFIRFTVLKFHTYYYLSTVFQDFCLMFCGGFFAEFLKINAPGGGVLARFLCSRGQGFALSLCPGGGAFALSKNSPGEWSGLESTDY